MAPAAYQQVLTALNAKLTSDFRRLNSARTPSAVSSASSTAGTDASSGLSQLQGVVPPVPLEAAHAALISALSNFGNDLQGAATAAGNSQVCTGPSATAMISRGNGSAQLRSAAAQLTAADPAHPAQVGTFLPPATADTSRRLANGTLIKDSTGGGLGTLNIANGGGTDATISLVLRRAHTATIAVYIRRRSSYTVTGIDDGSYQVYVTSGRDWDRHRFTRTCDFQKFDQDLNYTTTSSEYTTYHITLTPIQGGTATISPVDPGQFPAS
jgi:hypothetical protein